MIDLNGAKTYFSTRQNPSAVENSTENLKI